MALVHPLPRGHKGERKISERHHTIGRSGLSRVRLALRLSFSSGHGFGERARRLLRQRRRAAASARLPFATANASPAHTGRCRIIAHLFSRIKLILPDTPAPSRDRILFCYVEDQRLPLVTTTLCLLLWKFTLIDFYRVDNVASRSKRTTCGRLLSPDSSMRPL